jgi:glycogen(starch) synthase
MRSGGFCNEPRAQMKLFAALGPADIVAAHRKWVSPAGIANETSIIFSGQLYEYCNLRRIEALFTSHNASLDSLKTTHVEFVNVPRRWDVEGGWRFHIGKMAYALRLARRARRFGADLAIIDSGSAHYFALAIFRLMRIPVAVNFHNVRWPIGFEPRGLIARAIRRLDSWFFRRIAVGAIGCSPECSIQARCDGADRLPYFGWCAQFRMDGFPHVQVDTARNPFRLLFVGRVEQNKGVFDLIAIGNLLEQQNSVPVTIDICGDGSALDQLRTAVAVSGLSDRIFVRGRLERVDVLGAYGHAHAIVIPTRSNHCEGMPLVCAEAVLSGRPIVTSKISNALPVVGKAIAEAEPEDPTSYARTIRKLTEDAQYYKQLQRACAEESRQFLDRQRSYPAAVDRLIAVAVPEWKTLDRFDMLFEVNGPSTPSSDSHTAAQSG